VAYLFNIVNETQITDLYFHNVLHCASRRHCLWQLLSMATFCLHLFA